MWYSSILSGSALIAPYHLQWCARCIKHEDKTMYQLEHEAILFSPLFSNNDWLRIVIFVACISDSFPCTQLHGPAHPFKFSLDLQSNNKAATGTGPPLPALGNEEGPTDGLSRCKQFTRPTFSAQTELFLYFWLTRSWFPLFISIISLWFMTISRRSQI